MIVRKWCSAKSIFTCFHSGSKAFRNGVQSTFIGDGANDGAPFEGRSKAKSPRGVNEL
jgi:hypothetical protein